MSEIVSFPEWSSGEDARRHRSSGPTHQVQRTDSQRDMLFSMKMASRILPVLIVVVVGLLAASEWNSSARRDAGPAVPAVETKGAGFSTELVRVFDGDSLVVRSSSGEEIEIRIHAIDAPERRQAYANASRRALRELLEGEEIVVVELTRDRYDRVIAKLVVDGRDVGLDQIEDGFAWHYRKFAEQQSREERQDYANAERTARANRIGLWAGNDPTPPWEYRRKRSPRP